MSWIRQWLTDLSQNRFHRRGAVAFRIVAGSLVLYQLLINYGQRHVLYGPDGIVPWKPFAQRLGKQHLSILALSNSVTLFEGVFHAAIVVFLLWTAGFFTRWLTPLAWLLLHSLHARNVYLRDGGDNAIIILLLFACLLDLSNLTDARTRQVHRRGDAVRCILHNTGLVACVLQICTIYFVAGTAKLAGRSWVNGTAFYYVLASAEFGSPWLLSLLRNSRIAIALASWGPVLMQLSFPWIYLFGKAVARRWLVCIAIGFHLGIALAMDLISFAGFMVAAELLLLSDGDYGAISKRARQLVSVVATGCRVGSKTCSEIAQPRRSTR